MKKSIFALMLVLCTVFISAPTFCDSNVIFTEGTKESIENKRSKKSNIIVSGKVVEGNVIVEEDFPVSLNRQETRVVYLGQKIPFIEVIDAPYYFTRDIHGNIGLVYMQETLNIPIIANGGFYVVQKYNNITNQVEWVKYCIDNSGYVLFGWIVEEDGTKYYLSEDEATLGQVVKGPVLFKDNIICYFDSDGILQNMENADKNMIGESQDTIDPIMAKIIDYDLEKLGPRSEY